MKIITWHFQFKNSHSDLHFEAQSGGVALNVFFFCSEKLKNREELSIRVCFRFSPSKISFHKKLSKLVELYITLNPFQS